MASSNTMFHLLILLSVALIPLSVLANPVQQLEGHRCYWCGPLAEQVHRSQRAAKCNGDKSKVTVCDEDLPYCAIVASSPPYVESRYCVKLYQDECYPLYCNSTKIWKIICPCRGELCNGPNTKRENEVFEALHKLTQAQRPKRALISNGGFLSLTPRKLNKIDNVDHNIDSQNDDVKNKQNENAANSIIESADSQKQYTDKLSEMDPTVNLEALQAEVPIDLSSEAPKIEILSSDNSEITSSDSTEATKAEAIETTAVTAASDGFFETAAAETVSVVNNPVETTSVDTNAADITSTESNVAVDTIIKEETISKDVDVASIEGNTNEQNKVIEIPIGSFASDDLKIDTHVMSSDAPETVNDTKFNSEMEIKTGNIPNMQINITETKPTTEVFIRETTEMAKSNQPETKSEKSKSKSSENLPPAEALQHNDTPATKTMEPMHTTSTTAMSITNTHIDKTTQPTMQRKNTAARIDAQILTMIIGFVLQY